MLPDSTATGRWVLKQMGPEGGRDTLGEVTAFSSSLVAKGVFDFVKNILWGGSIEPSAFIQGTVTIVPGRCVMVSG
jgi:hypothetical protein